MMPPAAVYNWSGIYIGVHAGYGKGMKQWRGPSFDYDVQGFLAGGQIGLNQQIGNWVIGIEADASWANIRGSQAIFAGGAVIGITRPASGEHDIDRIVTVADGWGSRRIAGLSTSRAGRLGTREPYAFDASTFKCRGPAFTVSDSIAGSENRFGPMVGFGAEYALWGNWSFKSEYNYLDFRTARHG